MLIEFRVSNHRSIAAEQVLTLEAARGGDAEDSRPRKVANHDKQLLCAAALYGANASGKSNVLQALDFMRHAVLHSQRHWTPDGGVPREPFAWGAITAESSLFEVTFLHRGTRYQYGFSANDDLFLEEWLYAWPRGRKRVWFEREGASFDFGESLGGENRVVQHVTRANALFLSAAAQHGHEQLGLLYEWFGRLHAVNLPGRVLHFGTGRTLKQPLPGDWRGTRRMYAEGGESLARFHALLKAADLGIVDSQLADDSEDHRLPWRPDIRVQHRSSTGLAWLPLDEESHGTQTLFDVGATLVEALATGGILIYDELEAGLHPLLARRIVEQFDDPKLNPRNAQLIFTTHDTSLLGGLAGAATPLRRDQVWLTEKDNEGATHLYPLTDYKPRKAENLERGYLQGRYGAIPFLSELLPAETEDGK